MQSSIEQAKNTNDSLKNAARNTAARQSLSNFAGSISNGAARVMNYANPVTLTKNVWDAAGRLPETMAKYDRDYGNRVRADLEATKAKADAYSQKVSQPKPDLAQYDTPIAERKTKVPPPGSETGTRPVPEPDSLSTSTDRQSGASPYTGKPITAQQQSPYDINRSELLTQDGQRAYSDDGRKQGVPYFDNTYMTKRYGKEVYQPMTPERAEQQRLAAMSPEQRQQEFQNDLALRKHGLEIQKHNTSIGQSKKTPQFSKVYDDNYNETGSQYDGYFDNRSGRYIPAPQQQTVIHPQQLEQVRNAYARAKTKGTEYDFWQLMSQYDIYPYTLGVEK